VVIFYKTPSSLLLQLFVLYLEHFYNIAREISTIRNKIVHGQTDFSEQMIRDALESLDELMDEL
jgi:hypothetical protein